MFPSRVGKGFLQDSLSIPKVIVGQVEVFQEGCGLAEAGGRVKTHMVSCVKRTEKCLLELVKRLLGFKGLFLVKWRLGVESSERMNITQEVWLLAKQRRPLRAWVVMCMKGETGARLNAVMRVHIWGGRS